MEPRAAPQPPIRPLFSPPFSLLQDGMRIGDRRTSQRRRCNRDGRSGVRDKGLITLSLDAATGLHVPVKIQVGVAFVKPSASV